MITANLLGSEDEVLEAQIFREKRARKHKDGGYEQSSRGGHDGISHKRSMSHGPQENSEFWIGLARRTVTEQCQTSRSGINNPYIDHE